jgi:hypothetical protein
VVITCVVFTVGSFISSYKIRQTLTLFYENKKLLETIKLLLEVIPESLIIECYDEEKNQRVLKFANNYAKENIFEEFQRITPDISLNSLNLDTKVHEHQLLDKNDDANSVVSFENVELTSFHEFLEVEAINTLKSNKQQSKHIQLVPPEELEKDRIDHQNLMNFNVKTMKVPWEK